VAVEVLDAVQRLSTFEHERLGAVVELVRIHALFFADSFINISRVLKISAK
jgi:hypothetical protein